MIKFTLYLLIALIIVFPILRAGLIKQGFSGVTQTATLFISLGVWVGLVWYITQPSHMIGALVVIIASFEAALWLSSKLVNRWQSLGYLR